MRPPHWNKAHTKYALGELAVKSKKTYKISDADIEREVKGLDRDAAIDKIWELLEENER